MKTKQNKKPKTTGRHHQNNHIYIIGHTNTTKTTGKSPSLTETCSNAIMDYNNNNNNISLGGAKNHLHVILPIHQNAGDLGVSQKHHKGGQQHQASFAFLHSRDLWPTNWSKSLRGYKIPQWPSCDSYSIDFRSKSSVMPQSKQT